MPDILNIDFIYSGEMCSLNCIFYDGYKFQKATKRSLRMQETPFPGSEIL